MITLRTGIALVAALFVLAPMSAGAQDLTPDDPNDPNGPPPAPPPMPPPGQPGSVAPPPPAGSTEAHLQESTEQDNGMGLKLFYIQPEVGFGYATLGNALPDNAGAVTINGTPVANDGSKYRSGSGLALGLGAGFEFITFQLGGRLRMISTGNYNLWNAGGELMYQPGSGRLWPHIGLTVGYAWAANWKDEICIGKCALLDVHGLSVGARGGVQYFVTKQIEIGADATLDVLMLSRPSINLDPVYGQDGSGTGVALGVLAHLGVHLP